MNHTQHIHNKTKHRDMPKSLDASARKLLLVTNLPLTMPLPGYPVRTRVAGTFVLSGLCTLNIAIMAANLV